MCSSDLVSMPCVEWFVHQDAAYKEQVLPRGVRARVSIEAGIALGWAKYVGFEGASLSIETFGASASGNVMFEKLGPDTGYDTINNYTPVDQMAAFLGAVESASGLPRTILEAMATGRPVITTDMPGCREPIIEGENGFLVAPRDAAALAAAALAVVAQGPDQQRIR